MKYLLKYSPEISIKTRPVRVRFVKQLRRNLKTLLRRVHPDTVVTDCWDYLDITVPEAADLVHAEQVLGNTPGVHSYSKVREYPLTTLEDLSVQALDLFGERLKGRTFALRCKRAGQIHDFTSVDVEREVGGYLRFNAGAAGVSLDHPEVMVRIEIREDRAFVVDRDHPGIGGYPLGAQDGVLSLISGGFDSSVSSWMSIRRGMLTHYLFFNLGGREHEMAVKEVALYLWMKYGSSHRVRFITVPFENVVGEILEKIENPLMGVVLKRMMLRAAGRIAGLLELDALVTGESVSQVSSQTLRNLAVIDHVTDALVLRPLAMYDKQEIIDIARKIGTEVFSAGIPEYCGVISVNPTTRARPHRVVHEEQRFDLGLLDKAIDDRREEMIDELALDEKQVQEAAIYQEIPAGASVLDIRHPDDQEQSPLQLQVPVERMPFYRLASRFGDLDADTRWLLYCDKGVMSRLHASWLLEQGFSNVAVYRPQESVGPGTVLLRRR